jgi:putative ABC transport system permease protein
MARRAPKHLVLPRLRLAQVEPFVREHVALPQHGGRPGGTRRVRTVAGLRVNYDFFEMLGISMQLGRGFLPEEDSPDRRYEVILANGLWKRRFGGDPHIIGRVIRLSDHPFTVVGVLPAGFLPVAIPGSPATAEIFQPLGYALSDPFACRDCQHLQMIARLKPGVAAERAHAELDAIMAGLVPQFPESYPPQAKVAFEPLQQHIVGGVTRALWVLMGAAGFVLLIACVNVANLMLARAAGRTKEMALRAALGAARGRLVRQLLAESMLLAAAGGIAGGLLGAGRPCNWRRWRPRRCRA